MSDADPTDALLRLADARNRLTVEPLTRLAVQMAVLEAAVLLLVDTSPNRDAVERWLQLAGTRAEYDGPVD